MFDSGSWSVTVQCLTAEIGVSQYNVHSGNWSVWCMNSVARTGWWPDDRDVLNCSVG